MESDAKSVLAFACQTMLRPIVKILLRCGMTFQDFNAQAKAVFVEVGGSEYGLRGRPANASRIAIMTGLTRREIKRLRDIPPQSAPDGAQRVDRASRVLAGWHDDPQFVDKSGAPATLSENGPGRSFADLFSRYGGDVPMTAMLKELVRSGAVEITKKNRLRARHRYYMPVRTDPVIIERAATLFEDIGSTVYYNLNRSAEQPSRFEGRATNKSIPTSVVPAFREYLEEVAEELLDQADRWLGEHTENARQEKCVRLGVGLYQIIN